MKKVYNLFFLLPFVITSCSNKLYLEDYEPVRVFLKSQNIPSKEKYILKEKASNLQTLRIFNGDEGEEHKLYQNFDFTSNLFNEKYWKKLYSSHQDTTKKYWRDEDFKDFQLIDMESKKVFSLEYLTKYPGLDQLIVLSEPIYYQNKKYILFYYQIAVNYNSSRLPYVVIMKKQRGEWVVVEKIGDNIYKH